MGIIFLTISFSHHITTLNLFIYKLSKKYKSFISKYIYIKSFKYSFYYTET